MSRSSRISLSLSWRRDVLGVALFPNRIVMARVGGWRRRLKHRELVEFEPAASGAPAWQTALEALARIAAQGALADANVTLVLSSHFVQYTLVPWNDLLRREADQLAYARQRFIDVYGRAAETWALRLSLAEPRRPRLACGVPQGLLDGLGAVLAPIGRRYRSLQPHLMTSFNRWRARLGARPGWFVVAEPGLACVALLGEGGWRSLRALRVGDGWPEQLPEIIAREHFLIDAQAPCRRVSVFAPELPDLAAPQDGEWVIEHLRPALLPGMSATADAPFAIAVEA